MGYKEGQPRKDVSALDGSPIRTFQVTLLWRSQGLSGENGGPEAA